MDDFRMPGDGSFSLGSRTWPGLSKLVEECGEVLQIAGKIMGTGGAVQVGAFVWHVFDTTMGARHE